MKAILKSLLRIAVGTVAGIAVILTVVACFICRPRATGFNTSFEKKTLRFYRDGTEWFADVPQHGKAENRMVAGADKLLEDISGGKGEVFAVFSADVGNPDEWKLHLHLVEHDKFGATYSVKVAGKAVLRAAWLCNVTHTVCGGEHPTDIYVHSISAR